MNIKMFVAVARASFFYNINGAGIVSGIDDIPAIKNQNGTFQIGQLQFGWSHCPRDADGANLSAVYFCPISQLCAIHQQTSRSFESNMALSDFTNITFLGNGEGMMGSIYLAKYMEKKVVLKTSREDLPISHELEFELKKEIDILKRIKNPYVVGLLGSGYVTKSDAFDPHWRGMNPFFRKPFAVLEYLEGGTLAEAMGLPSYTLNSNKNSFSTHPGADSIEYILRRRQFPTLRALEIGKEVAKALASLHDLRYETGIPIRIIHRDLKPGNIMFDGNGKVKLVDFSMAAVIEYKNNEAVKINEKYELTGEKGNIRFMAPEVARKEPYNEKVDIYSFGLLLWEMLTLEKPFSEIADYRNQYWQDQWYKHVVDNNYRPHIADEWDAKLQNLLCKCWNEDPAQRPSARKIYRILSEIIEKWNAKSSP